MKNIKNYFFLLIIIYFFIFFYKESIFFFTSNLFQEMTYFQSNNFIFFIFLLFLINFIFFLSPIPTLPIIIFNGFSLGNSGFIFSYILIIICSLILFKIAKNINFLLKFKYFEGLVKKINNNQNNDLNLFAIASSRFVLPYFFHNILFGSILKKTNIFVFAILISEIPIIYVLNKFGKHLRDFQDLSIANLNNVLKIEYFSTFFLFLLLLIIASRFSKYLRGKIR